VQNCSLCGHPAARVITVSEERLCIGDRFRYAVCGGCGLVQLIDKPADMERYYRNYSYHGTRPKAVTTRESGLYRKVSGFLLSMTERYVPADTGLRVLDVGCARGEYLARLRRAGFARLVGIEVSPEAVTNKVDPALNILCTSLERFDTDDCFDLITLNQVFEHFEDPSRMLEKLRSLLAPRGVVVMSFPNAASLARALFGRFWPGWDAPRHYFTFSPRNVRLLAQKGGMEVSRIRYVSRPSQFLGSLQYLSNRFARNKQGLETGWWRNAKLLDLLLFPPAYLLNLLRLGDMIEVHVRVASGKNDGPGQLP
jgi:SAM-dependent methyltransferase